ncbi:MAG: class I SAM-dependent methyltransferase [Planctomycetota bacterium]|nr:class I SAM-dependent methyltransferase [Planctomycetota bacterium]
MSSVTTKGSKKSKRKTQKKKGWRTAASSDRYELYELAVQEAGSEIAFFDRVYKERTGVLPKLLREDFCGTASVCAQWAKSRKENRAWGVDLCGDVLAWGKKRSIDPLAVQQRARVSLVQENVLTAKVPKVDILAALNFSYFIFKERRQLIEYFRAARAALRPRGVCVFDAYGGSEAHSEIQEERSLDGFVYVWDQNKYNPITGFVLNHIHFRFPDGSELKRAFSYNWRLWSLPEIQDALYEVGFKKVAVYWEGTDHSTSSGNGNFFPSTCGEACEGWIAYIVAER